MSDRELNTREKILSAARQEFLDKGYQGAWLRDIARKAGVTTGALYGYFKNKEELFSTLVSECYSAIQSMYKEALLDFSRLTPEQQKSDMEELSTQGMIRMAEYMYQHHDEFKLLLCCAQDTEYGDLIEQMALLDEQATRDFAETTQAAGVPVRRIMPQLEHILTTGMITMFFELIIHDVPREEADEYIISLIQFFTGGYSKIMGF